MVVSIPLCYAPAQFLIQVTTPKRPERPSSPPAGCQPPRREGTSEDGMYKNELRPQEAQVTTTMTHPEWQFTGYFLTCQAAKKCVQVGTLVHCWWNCKTVQQLWETVWIVIRNENY